MQKQIKNVFPKLTTCCLLQNIISCRFPSLQSTLSQHTVMQECLHSVITTINAMERAQKAQMLPDDFVHQQAQTLICITKQFGCMAFTLQIQCGWFVCSSVKLSKKEISLSQIKKHVRTQLNGISSMAVAGTPWFSICWFEFLFICAGIMHKCNINGCCGIPGGPGPSLTAVRVHHGLRMSLHQPTSCKLHCYMFLSVSVYVGMCFKCGRT